MKHNQIQYKETQDFVDFMLKRQASILSPVFPIVRPPESTPKTKQLIDFLAHKYARENLADPFAFLTRKLHLTSGLEELKNL